MIVASNVKGTTEKPMYLTGKSLKVYFMLGLQPTTRKETLPAGKS